MKLHIFSLIYAIFISIGFFIVLAIVADEPNGWCNVNMGESTATMPCEQVQSKIYEVKL